MATRRLNGSGLRAGTTAQPERGWADSRNPAFAGTAGVARPSAIPQSERPTATSTESHQRRTRAVPRLFTGGRDRLRQNRSLFAPDRTGAGTRQTGAGAGTGNWLNPTNGAALSGALRRSGSVIALRPERPRTPAGLAPGQRGCG